MSGTFLEIASNWEEKNDEKLKKRLLGKGFCTAKLCRRNEWRNFNWFRYSNLLRYIRVSHSNRKIHVGHTIFWLFGPKALIRTKKLEYPSMLSLRSSPSKFYYIPHYTTGKLALVLTRLSDLSIMKTYLLTDIWYTKNHWSSPWIYLSCIQGSS